MVRRPEGEIVTLPLVVLIAFLPQPRLLYIMSVDELFPKSIGGGIVRGIIYTIYQNGSKWIIVNL